MDWKRWLGWLALYLAGTALAILVYALVVSERGPASLAPELAVVVGGIDPKNGAGLRVDVIIDAPVSVTGCPAETRVVAIISGTPRFWKANAGALKGIHRVGIGLRSSYDPNSLRLAALAGYQLPRDLGNITGARIPHPSLSRRVQIATSADRSTRARWYTASIRDWGSHWTPLVLEFKDHLTSRRSLGSCYVVLPAVIGVNTPTVDDADAAVAGVPTVFALKPSQRKRGAVTFGRVIVHTNGRLLDSEARPQPRLDDRNPWVSELGEVGEEAAVWTCNAGTRRAQWPHAGVENSLSHEVALDPNETENPTCEGLAVIEARDSPTIRDLSLLVIGGVFALIFGQLAKHLVAPGRWLYGKLWPEDVDDDRGQPHPGEEADEPYPDERRR
jgi:hypothetical protein